MIKWILIDLDETIMDYENVHNNALYSVYKTFFKDKLDINDIYEKIKSEIHVRLHCTATSHSRFLYFKELCEYYKLNDYEFILKVHNHYWSEYHNHLKLKDGILELFDFCVIHSIKICLISDFMTEHQLHKLHKFNLLKYFDCIVTSEEVGVEKPHPYIYNYVFNKLGITKFEAIMIGDNFKRDIESAINYGIFACHYTDKHMSKKDNNKKDNSIKWFTNHIEYTDHNDIVCLLKTLNDVILKYVYMNSMYGIDNKLIQAGGGNISIKFNIFDTRLILVKVSGYNLCNINMFTGYCIFQQDILEKELFQLVKNKTYSDDLLDSVYKKSRTWIKNGNPSIEASFHSLCKCDYVIHLHTFDSKGIDGITKASIVPYIKPGILISKYMYDNNMLSEKLVYLENHGIIIQESDISIFNMPYINNEIHSSLIHLIPRKLVITNVVDKNIDLTNYPPTPDIAVYCGLLNVNPIVGITDKTKICIYDNIIYYICNNVQEYKNIKEVFEEYLCIPKDIKRLSNSDINEIVNWEREKYRNINI